MKSVYLAGPITGLTFGECTDWRQYAKGRLLSRGIVGLSPMRGKDYLIKAGKLAAVPEGQLGGSHLHALSRSRGIITRDRWDATRCDVLLVNFVGAKQISIGTAMEIAWADLCRIPIVCAMEPGNVHEHGMVNEAIGFRVDTLDEAIDVVEAILNE